jgi:hypothetical protein
VGTTSRARLLRILHQIGSKNLQKTQNTLFYLTMQGSGA